jgi:hypothetical protein
MVSVTARVAAICRDYPADGKMRKNHAPLVDRMAQAHVTMLFLTRREIILTDKEEALWLDYPRPMRILKKHIRKSGRIMIGSVPRFTIADRWTKKTAS